MSVGLWVYSQPEWLEKPEENEMDLPLKRLVEQMGCTDLNCMNTVQIEKINDVLKSCSAVWNALDGEPLARPYIISHRFAGTARHPFDGESLMKRYEKNFGVSIKFVKSPILIDGVYPHAIEYVWVRVKNTRVPQDIEQDDVEDWEMEDVEEEIMEDYETMYEVHSEEEA